MLFLGLMKYREFELKVGREGLLIGEYESYFDPLRCSHDDFFGGN